MRLQRFGAITGTVLDENDVGLPEYEVYTEVCENHVRHEVAVTLLRCVGNLSRRGDGPGGAHRSPVRVRRIGAVA